MGQTYSMDGFEFAVRDGVIEMRSWGERAPAALGQTKDLVDRLTEHSGSFLLLYDMRGADFVLSEIEMKQRANIIARQLASFRVACVTTAAQFDLYAMFRDAHHGLGGQNAAFASIEDGRAWLKDAASGIRPQAK